MTLSRLLFPALLGVLLHSQGALAYCYYDSLGRYRCTSTLSDAARIGIAIAAIVSFGLFLAALFFYRRRKAQARNAILLQNQQARPNQWGPPPPGGSYYNTSPPGVGGYPNNGYPMYPNSTNGPQPFQPGYQGGYTGDFGPKEYGAGPNATPLQEPPRSYDPSQPHSQYAPPPGSPPNDPAATSMPNQPPSYSGYAAPPGSPPTQSTGASNNPYTYVPPDTTKT